MTKLVMEDDGREAEQQGSEKGIVGAALLRVTAEAYLFCIRMRGRRVSGGIGCWDYTGLRNKTRGGAD